MSLPVVCCSNCRDPLPADWFNSLEPRACRTCHEPIRALVFPSLYRKSSTSSAGELSVGDAEATCYYHPQKKALIPCQRCGRFLCGLCDVELNGEHLCTGCIESGQQRGKLPGLEARRVLYDDIALALATYPILIWPVTFITAPAAIFMAVRHWKTQTSIINRSKARKIFAILLGLLQICGWIALITAIVMHR